MQQDATPCNTSQRRNAGFLALFFSCTRSLCCITLQPVATEWDHNGTTRMTSRRLTHTKIEAAKPRSTRYEIADPTIAGLQLRVEPSGRKSWLLRYYWRGKRVRFVIGSWPTWNQAKARDMAADARRQIDRGIDPRRAFPKRRNTSHLLPSQSGLDAHSLGFLAQEFMERFVSPNRKRPEYVRRILEADVLRDGWRMRDAERSRLERSSSGSMKSSRAAHRCKPTERL